MSAVRPFVISIAGLDPSGGAGLLADIKTLEMHRVQGLGIASAVTFQSENHFQGMKWLPETDIFNQLESLLHAYQPRAVKIGIIENLPVLGRLVERLKKQFPDVKIVWDPVLNASAGFEFHAQLDPEQVTAILNRIDLITPNLPESDILFGTASAVEIARKTSCPVLLTGGHSSGQLATDILMVRGEIHRFQHQKKAGFSKHGTGCVLSSAIAANLALGKELPEACRDAKEYIQQILISNSTRLAYHYDNQ